MDTDSRGIRAGGGKRRSYSRALKRQIVEETLSGQESVSVIARRHDVNANQVFKWRRLYRAGGLGAKGPAQEAQLVPVQVSGLASGPETVSIAAGAVSEGRIEIDCGVGRRVVVRGAVCARTLRVVLEALGVC